MSKSDEEERTIPFITAVVYARKIQLLDRLVRLTGGHRGQVAKLDLGYIVIEKEWHVSG